MPASIALLLGFPAALSIASPPLLGNEWGINFNGEREMNEKQVCADKNCQGGYLVATNPEGMDAIVGLCLICKRGF
jgi:hypothetical protein